jgi:hypothetical protein
VTLTSALSQDILEHRKQPKSNASIDRTEVFDSLGTESVRLVVMRSSVPT